MPVFWSVPTGIWTIDFDVPRDRITISCNGQAAAWGSFYYLDDMVTTFRRYQFASGKPDCKECGHSFIDHLSPSGFEIDKFRPPCDCPKVVHIGCLPALEACHWGGGHEGWCYCEGYIAKI